MKIKSTAVASATWSDGILKVRLKGEKKAIQYVAPEKVFNALKKAPSAGVFFNTRPTRGISCEERR